MKECFPPVGKQAGEEMDGCQIDSGNDSDGNSVSMFLFPTDGE